jgi:hypothetical protein
MRTGSKEVRNSRNRFLYRMPKDQLLINAFYKVIPLQRLVKKELARNLGNSGIHCQSGAQANQFIFFTKYYTDLDLMVPYDMWRQLVFVPVLSEAVAKLKTGSMSELADPCVKVEIQRESTQVGFSLTVSLWFVSAEKTTTST